MHDSAYTADPPTTMRLAFDKAGFHRIDPENTVLRVSLEPPPRDDDYLPAYNPVRSTSATASVCDALEVFGGAPDRDEFDRRDVYDEEDSCAALAESIRTIVAGVAQPGSQLNDELEPLLWGFVNMLHAQTQRLDRTIDKMLPEMRELERAQDGTEINALQLEMLTHRVQNLSDRRDAFERLRDFAASAYQLETGEMWRPRYGSHASQTRKLTSASIDARDFRRARDTLKNKAHMPNGTLVAVTGGKQVSETNCIWETLDRAKTKYGDIVLIHGDGPGTDKIASSWAAARGVHQIVCRPDWNAHGRAAPFRRNDDLLNMLPKGIIAFPGSGISGNLVDKARQLGIPVYRVTV